MDKLVIGILMVVLLIGGCFWVFNNDNGINDAIENGGRTINSKTSGFDYNGMTAPGAGHSTDWVATPTTND
ncbi:hypothetical protein SY83_12990 [Paenibacillus swuensis]|uniref:Uncharacterized protein n=1 Tax=Paenibacillus swuensis TaxID=1178515 RepID=A0A172TJ92_9BACL|nr:hypothetical protein [Paenibacillus swuensis]ANE47032.1 hypothetical protein SY83_12990 [Paenibacillus swuensis]